MGRVLPLLERLERFIEPEPMSGCWLWTGYWSKSYGYGMIRLRKGGFYVHRVLYELHRGVEIPAPLTLDHLCRTPACVNPSHMEAVTIRVNILRGNGLGARNARKTHCKRGHELTPSNRMRSGKATTCRICQLLYLKAWNMAKALGYYKCQDIA